MKKRIIIIVALQVFVFLLSSSLFAQQPYSSDSSAVEQINPEPCEFNNINLEGANLQTGKDSMITGKSKIIILIGRPGKKDTKKGITARRLYTAQAYLTDYLNLRKKETVITAEAPNNGNEYGVIEIYVTGQLYYVLASNPNADIGFGSCEGPELEKEDEKRRFLYPWDYKKKENGRKKVKSKNKAQ